MYSKKERPDFGGINNPRYKHGMKGTRIYNIWKGIKVRCYNKNRIYYKNYGGRGIIVCDRWLNSFENFYEDMSLSYISHCKKHGEVDTTIDRINNDGNYEKDNCKWSTKLEQSINSRNTKKIEYKGTIKTVKEIAKIMGISHAAMGKRINKGYFNMNTK